MADLASETPVPPPPVPHQVQRTIQKRKRLCEHPGCNRLVDMKNFSRHKLIHAGKRPYVCDYPGCSKSFGQKVHLTSHKTTHTGDEPFVCTFPGCNARFARNGNLKSHERIHTGDKPYACDYEGCKACFRTSDRLAQHKRIHTGERPYACDFEGCGARFKLKGALNCHKRTHTGEKPYACDFEGCDARFATKQTLKRHKLAIHTARGQQRQKKKEERVARYLTDAGITFEREVTISFCGEVERRFARVDFTIYREWGTDILEVDEDQHSHYPTGCDAARMLNIFAEVMKRGDRAGKIRFIRFNPDPYRVDGEKQKTSQRDRHTALMRVLESVPEQQFSVVYLFYDRTGPLPDVCLDPEFPNTVRAIASATD
jgi:hypothetical protein